MSYTSRQLVLAALAANALRPLRHPRLGVPTFFAGWLTDELAPHLIGLGALDTLVAEGAIRNYGVSVERTDEALEAIRRPGTASASLTPSSASS